MGKSIYRQYNDLRKESEDLKSRISKLEQKLQRLEEGGVVKDLVYGGDGGQQPFHIEGIPYSEISKVKTSLYTQKLRYEEAVRSVDALRDDIDQRILEIEDAELRLMCRYYFIDGKRQQWIALKMHLDQATVSRKLKPFGAIDE